MTKTTRNLALLAAFSIIVAGCATLFNTQADFWADQAEQIARNCPAAAEQASLARESARKAEKAEQMRQDILDGYAELHGSAGVTESKRLSLQAHELQKRIKSGQCHDYDEPGSWDSTRWSQLEYLEGLSSHHYCCFDFRGVRIGSCQDNLDNRNDVRQACTADGNYYQNANETAQGIRAKRRNLPSCKELEDEAAFLRRSAAESSSWQKANAACREYWGPDRSSCSEQDFQELPVYLQKNAENHANSARIHAQEAQRIAAEQCGEGAALQDAPPNPSLPSGEYPQDILNSQPMGLPALPSGPAPLACCSTIPMCGICTGDCPPSCSVCNTGC